MKAIFTATSRKKSHAVQRHPQALTPELWQNLGWTCPTLWQQRRTRLFLSQSEEDESKEGSRTRTHLGRCWSSELGDVFMNIFSLSLACAYVPSKSVTVMPIPNKNLVTWLNIFWATALNLVEIQDDNIYFEQDRNAPVMVSWMSFSQSTPGLGIPKRPADSRTPPKPNHLCLYFYWNLFHKLQ